MAHPHHSFAAYKPNNTIQLGDFVVLYLGRENLQLIRIQDGGEFNCKFGSYRHSDMIGLQYGTKLGSNTGRGFVYLLYPTPELWTQILPHRTQILYVADISLVMNYLNLKPGMLMIESGTGSGSFTHSIARTIAPTGHLYTFEYHQDRVDAAVKEFEEHGLSEMVTLQCRDVCKDGFGIEDKVDAVFLDLPAPWEAIASAKRAFKQNKSGKICTFSPCIEQISKTVIALKDHGFADIQMYECLIRFHELRVLPMLTIDEALEMECAAEKKRKRALPRVIREALKKDQTINSKENSGADDDDDDDVEAVSSKKCRESLSSSSRTEDSPSSVSTIPSISAESSSLVQNYATPRDNIEARTILTTRLPAEQRGHTSYLLFATFTPAVQRPSQTELDAAAKK
ncbi:tRNA (adenine-N(1)-)-methyltransferase catalytic subunit trm61 [Mortierella sp. GBA43]|nr:tRNA (adenine-N(1)-)-methyltransferase catalytic subunit trm61 [Mortierella sp. GBA43]